MTSYPIIHYTSAALEQRVLDFLRELGADVEKAKSDLGRRWLGRACETCGEWTLNAKDTTGKVACSDHWIGEAAAKTTAPPLPPVIVCYCGTRNESKVATLAAGVKLMCTLCSGVIAVGNRFGGRLEFGCRGVQVERAK